MCCQSRVRVRVRVTAGADGKGGYKGGGGEGGEGEGGEGEGGEGEGGEGGTTTRIHVHRIQKPDPIRSCRIVVGLSLCPVLS